MLRKRPCLLPGLLFGLFLIAAGCADEGGPTDPPPLAPPASPELTVSDGTSATGNPHFFWLPPVASNPNATGEVNQGLLSAVVVRVCEITADPYPCRSAALDGPGASSLSLAEFTDEGGTGGALVGLGTDSYQVDWKTSETANGVSLSGRTVRIWVLLGKARLEEQIVIGSIDVSFAEDGKQARGRSGDALREGRTLPLRFRMEQGVAFGGDCLEGDGLDCVEFVGSDDGFEECTEESGACLQAEPGWLPDGFEGAVLIQVKQEPLVAGECFDGLPLPQREACYRISTVPDLGSAEFNGDVFFSMCQEPNMPANFEIHQRSSNGEVRRPVAEPSTPVELDCDAFELAAITPLSRLARSFREFVFGRPLHAADGLTARLSSFSEFFWAPAAEFASVTAPATADPDETISVQLQLGLDHGSTGDLSGIAVEIEVDGGSLAPGPYVSDVNGVVLTDWTLPSVPDIYTLEARIPVLVEADGFERSISWEVEVLVGGSPAGTVFGSVIDVSQNPIVGASVTTPDLDPVLATSTDVLGNYLLSNVPTGLQGIQVQSTGFRSMIGFVEVVNGGSALQGFVLSPSGTPDAPDQENDQANVAAYGCGVGGGSLFQSFTPGEASLAAVQLGLNRGGSLPADGVVTELNIRSQGPAGPILASSSVEVPSGPIGFPGESYTFTISPVLQIQAGTPLFIEWLSPVEGGSYLTWRGSEDGVDPYAGGTAYGCGATATTWDMNFVTLSIAPPAP